MSRNISLIAFLNVMNMILVFMLAYNLWATGNMNRELQQQVKQQQLQLKHCKDSEEM